MAGARWVQKQLLEKYTSANLRVYAVWFKMWPGDDRSSWAKDLLRDARVIQFWDPDKTVGKFYLDHFGLNRSNPGGALWDVYILYDAKAEWKGVPSPPASWGYGVRPGGVTILQVLGPSLLPK